MNNKPEYYLNIALKEAKKAESEGQIPVGALIVSGDGEIISSSRNQHGIKHAEIVAIDDAMNKLRCRKLEGYYLYTTLEPCIMCAGAILNAHISKVYFSAWDSKFGASGSVWDLLRDPLSPHHPEVYGGIDPEESEQLLKQFFINKR